jgi:hypothetical protein
MSDPTLKEILDAAEESHEKCVQYAAQLFGIHRRLNATLQLLEENNVEGAKEMIKQAIADDGSILRARIDKIARRVLGEYGQPNDA